MALQGRPLEGRVALVTGASRGLGAATARQLAGWGARVILTYRSQADAAEAVARECSALTPGARTLQLDLLEEDSVRAAFARVAEDEERLDVLVASAAATALKPLMELKLHQIDKTFAISVRHFILMAQLAFPLLERAEGRIIAVSGADTVSYIPRHGLLAAAKSSMETLVRYLGCELGPAGITAYGILPGFIATDSMRYMTGPYYDRMVQEEVDTHPLRTAATAEQAAEAIGLLCLDEARWLTGQVIQNDGAGLFAMFGRHTNAVISGGEGRLPGSQDAPIVGL